MEPTTLVTTRILVQIPILLEVINNFKSKAKMKFILEFDFKKFKGNLLSLDVKVLKTCQSPSILHLSGTFSIPLSLTFIYISATND